MSKFKLYHKVPHCEGFTRRDVIEFLRSQLLVNKKWQLRALELIFESQTHEERKSSKSLEENGIGFGKYDAYRMSRIYHSAVYRTLSNDEFLVLSKVIPKYAAQIASKCDPDKLTPLLLKFYGNKTTNKKKKVSK